MLWLICLTCCLVTCQQICRSQYWREFWQTDDSCEKYMKWVYDATNQGYNSEYQLNGIINLYHRYTGLIYQQFTTFGQRRKLVSVQFSTYLNIYNQPFLFQINQFNIQINQQSFNFRTYYFDCFIITDNWLEIIFQNQGYSQNAWFYISSLIIYVKEIDCQDDNLIPFDGCFNDYYSCSEGCQNCINGECWNCYDEWLYDEILHTCEQFQKVILIEQSYIESYNMAFIQQCQFGYQMNNNDLQCNSICGDGIITIEEYCDDQNDSNDDGCYLCQQICFQHCIKCSPQQCLVCEIGYYSQDLLCIPQCGDQVIVQEYEECDDGNNIQYDGCFQCQYQCRQNCQNCFQGNCLDQCEYGTYQILNQCQSICGDNIIANNEQCEDENDEQYDGCYNCQYSCPLYCIDCDEGQCHQCDQSLQLQNNKCLDYCGNGILTQNENCDDGNQESNDGCTNQCNQEQNWQCINYEFGQSICNYILAPEIKLEFLNQSFAMEYVLLSFTQQVKTIEEFNFTQSIECSIMNLQEQIYNITIYPIQEITKDVVNNVQYLIIIQFYQQIENKTTLNVNLIGEVYNQQNVKLNENTKQLVLLKPEVLSQSTLDQATTLQDFGSYIMLGLIGISIISLFIGQGDICFQIINTLQYQSYFKYINIQFPQNLVIYFESSNILTLEPIFNIINFQGFTNNIIIENQTLQSYEKFLYYQLDADLLNNIQSQLFQLFLILICLLSLRPIKLFIYNVIMKYKFFHFFVKLYFKYHYKIIEKLSKAIELIARNMLTFQNKKIKKLFYNITEANTWDLLFKSLIFIQTLSLNNLRFQISFILAIIIIIGYNYFIITNLTDIQYTICQKRKLKLERQFQSFTLMKQNLFLIVLVFFQNNQVLQTTLISLIILFHVIIQINYSNRQELTQSILSNATEISLLVFTSTTFFYFKEMELIINIEMKVKIGFIHIGILSLTLFIQGFIILYNPLKKLWTKQIVNKSSQVQPLFQ